MKYIEIRLHFEIRDNLTDPEDVKNCVPFNDETIKEVLRDIETEFHRRKKELRGYVLFAHGPYKGSSQ